jgi:hypothetical protein
VSDATKVDLPLEASTPAPEVMVPLIAFPEILVGAFTEEDIAESCLVSLPHPVSTRLNITPTYKIIVFINIFPNLVVYCIDKMQRMNKSLL